MIRQRRGQPSHDEESSDEEDAFSALSRKSSKGKKSSKEGGRFSQDGIDRGEDHAPKTLPASTTSSMKRHHVSSNDTRKAKMDALLMELEAEKSRRPRSQERRGFVPEKKGSFVEPGEEHLTTNVFVGNLAPSITEEELTDLFRQFGDLYSVKIMWPRTPEEKARMRNTGFVCFMERTDAEEAMDACNEADPFNVGRRLMMRWGKNVKKFIKRGTGGVAIAPILKRPAPQQPDSKSTKRRRDNSPCDSTFDSSTSDISVDKERQQQTRKSDQRSSSKFDPSVHEKTAIRVVVPDSVERAQFISTVASYVAKDGSNLEQKLLELEATNPKFSFLTVRHDSEKGRLEHIFYRWRVYAYCQGDGNSAWRTEPFIMIGPKGAFWIPPSLDKEAALEEERNQQAREEDIQRQKQRRRRLGSKREFLTGRQLEQSKSGRGRLGGADGGIRLLPGEVDQFNNLVKKKLCASRDAICEAMAFCFEKSAAATQIARLLKECLLDDQPSVSVETRIARLYLLSDVLFNSQQPGVKNAFLYRDAIEQMSPEVFASLGKHGGGNIGRMTKNKLSTAVSSVLAAWTNWSVYNPMFLDELHARFEGREIVIVEKVDEEEKEDDSVVEHDAHADSVKVLKDNPRGGWSDVKADEDEVMTEALAGKVAHKSELFTEQTHEKAEEMDVGGELKEGQKEEILKGVVSKADTSDKHADDVDGQPTSVVEDQVVEDFDDLDGEPLCADDFDSDPFEEEDDDVDGIPVESEDVMDATSENRGH